MVSRSRSSPRARRLAAPAPAASSRERLLRAAAAEFAARGFDGAKVDRIAARARVNKAMLYYHFDHKAALYRAILRDRFQTVAAALQAADQAGAAPADRLRAFIRALARQLAALPDFPALWLRELVEGGRHLDLDTIAPMRAIVEVFGGLLRDGRRAGVFGDVNPFIAQLGIVGPLLMVAASAPVRQRFGAHLPAPVSAASFEEAIAYVEATTLAAVLAPGPRVTRRAPARRSPS